jgi:hypothetical protein
MRGFLINKNLCFYYWLRRRIGKTLAFRVANTIEKITLILGRKAIPYERGRQTKSNRNEEVFIR